MVPVCCFFLLPSFLSLSDPGNFFNNLSTVNHCLSLGFVTFYFCLYLGHFFKLSVINVFLLLHLRFFLFSAKKVKEKYLSANTLHHKKMCIALAIVFTGVKFAVFVLNKYFLI